jgi:hypothetical protein
LRRINFAGARVALRARDHRSRTIVTPIFRSPNAQVGASNFGRISSQANFARILQLSLRLMW